MPIEIVLGGRPSGRSLGHEGGILVNEVSAVVRDSTELPTPFCPMGTQREVCHPEEGRGSSPSMLVL